MRLVAYRPDMPEGTWHADRAEFMLSVKWHAIREGAIERAGRKCERCGCKPRVFNVHHLSYVRFGGEELPGDLQALCRRCHLNAHDLTRSGAKRKPGQLPSLKGIPKEERRRRRRERKRLRKLGKRKNR